MRSSGGYPRVTLRELGAHRQAACVGASRCTRMQNEHDSAVETQTVNVWQGDDSEAGDLRQFRNSPFSTCGRGAWRVTLQTLSKSGWNGPLYPGCQFLGL